MKSKYFIIFENADGTFDIRSKNGRSIDTAAHTYEINPKQPKYIKVKHDGGRWCSLYHYRGYAAKEAMWVHDVVLFDDGSYQVKEYMHETHWKHYNNPEKNWGLTMRMAVLYSVVVVSMSVGIGFIGRSLSNQVEKNTPVPQTAPIQIPIDNQEGKALKTWENERE